MGILKTMGLTLLLLQAGGAPHWEFAGGIGALRFIYVEPSHMDDTKLLADIVEAMYVKFGKDRPMEIDFFDSKAAIPATLPFTADQRKHQKGKFNFNPKNNLQRFVRVEVVADPNDAAKLRLRETEVKLPLP